MRRKKFSGLEFFVLSVVSLVIAMGFALRYNDIEAFDWYVKEDHLVEWLTVAGLVLASIVCLVRFTRLVKHKNWWFLLVTILLGLFLFFAAGEEISWGQRLLGIKSSEFFEKNNAQGETNLHNLVVNGVKINKLIFSALLSIVMGVYLLLVPVLYQKNKKIKNLLNASAIPVPRVYQIVAFVLLFAITALLNHEKNAELLECGATLLFFLVVANPKNNEIFQR